MLTGSAAAGGIALINSVGNLCGFLGPVSWGTIVAPLFDEAAALTGNALQAALHLTSQIAGRRLCDNRICDGAGRPCPIREVNSHIGWRHSQDSFEI